MAKLIYHDQSDIYHDHNIMFLTEKSFQNDNSYIHQLILN